MIRRLRSWLASTPAAGLRLRLVLAGATRRVPVTPNEKVRYRMAADRRPILTTLVDKVAVREYIAERVGADLLPDLVAVVADSRGLEVASLPDRCIIKPAHGSGVIIAVDDRAPEESRLPRRDPTRTWQYLKVRVRREALVDRRFRLLAASWLRADYSKVGGGWCYRDVPHRLIVEELLDAGDGRLPADHRIWCVEGRPVLISRDEGWGAQMRRVRLTPDWTPVVAAAEAVEVPPRPGTLGRMLELAEALSDGLDFVRVDLYDVAGRLVVGELTTYPGGGHATFAPEQVYTRLFADWHPERIAAGHGRRPDR